MQLTYIVIDKTPGSRDSILVSIPVDRRSLRFYSAISFECESN